MHVHAPRRGALASLLPAALAALALVTGSASAQAPAGQSRKAARGDPAATYHNYCSVCHGDRGDGRSRASNSLVPPPRSFTTPSAAQELGRERMLDAVRNGRPGTAMTGWKTQLSDTDMEAVVDYVRTTFMQPAGSPTVQRGMKLYQANCASCHGEQGQGGAPVAGSGPRPARNFRAPEAVAELTPERMLQTVANGKPGTAMPAFGARLGREDLDAVVEYVRTTLMLPPAPGISGTSAHAGPAVPARPAMPDTPAKAAPVMAGNMTLPFPGGKTGDAAKGRTFYMANCATCHGEKGDGQGPRAYFIRPKPRNLIEDAARAQFNRPALFAAIANGRLGTEMPAWNKVLTDQEIANVGEFVFQAFIRTPAAAARK